MPIKREVVNIEGKEIAVKELSFLSDFRLAELREKNGGKLSMLEVLKECLSAEDFKYLEELTRDEAGRILEAAFNVNGWKKEAQDFPNASQTST